MDKKSIGKRIQIARERKGISQAQLAKAIGLVSPSAISSIECGVRLTRLDKFIDMANVLDTTADELLQDVLNKGYEHQLTALHKTMIALPSDERKKAIKMLQLLFDTVVEMSFASPT